MLRMFTVDALRSRARKSALLIQAAVLAVAGMAPVLISGSASAAQLTSRSVTISTSKASATGVDYNFQFSYGSSVQVQSAILQFCTTPLGTCTLPTGMVVNGGTVGTLTQINSNSGVDGTLATSDTNDCSDADQTTASTMICFPITSGSASTATNATIPVANITNPSISTPNYTTVYVRVSLYSTTNYSSASNGLAFDGTVAASINQQLTVSGRVQERLNFCVAALTDDGTTADGELPTNIAGCGALTTTVVDLGVIDNSGIAKSPVANSPPSSQGNARYGIAMLNTNASNGTAITYYAEADTTSGATNQLRSFRVPGASCNASSSNLTDQCFQSASTTGTTFAAGTEDFGLNVPCLIQKDGVNPTINSVATTTANLSVTSSYNGDGTLTPAADCEKSETAAEKYSWNDTSTASTIAESNTSTTGSKVVDNEIVKLNFAATSASTTPTGSYTVSSTYIATPTF